MLSFSLVFWIFIVVFGLIGALRGWGKELLVSFSIILALFVIQVIQEYVPPVANLLTSENTQYQFYLWGTLVVAFALFGYHTPNIHKLTGTKLMTRDRVQDWLLGGFIGACNGYLLVGTLWFYLDLASYPFPEHIMKAPVEGSTAAEMIALLPPVWLGVPIIYFAVAIAFTFVVIVFI